MEKIILDTNFLLSVIDYKIDLFSELDRICDFNYKLLTLDKVVDEIKDISKKQKGKHRRNAEFSFKLINKIGILNTKKGFTDDILVKMSKNYIIATQDLALRKRLKGKKIIIRQKKHLAFI